MNRVTTYVAASIFVFAIMGIHSTAADLPKCIKDYCIGDSVRVVYINPQYESKVDSVESLRDADTVFARDYSLGGQQGTWSIDAYYYKGRLAQVVFTNYGNSFDSDLFIKACKKQWGQYEKKSQSFDYVWTDTKTKLVATYDFLRKKLTYCSKDMLLQQSKDIANAHKVDDSLRLIGSEKDF